MLKIGELPAHNADSIDEGVKALEEYAKHALLAAYDGCHKIYLAMDEIEANRFRDTYGQVVESGEVTSLSDVVRSWYVSSCGLRFVTAVWTTKDDPNDGYVPVIQQFAE